MNGTFDNLITTTDSIFEFDAVAIYSLTEVQVEITDVRLLGDFNDDLALDCADVDALVAELVANGVSLDFDLNGDNLVNMDDLDEWLAIAGTFNVGGPYVHGDANLDGSVDVSDFNVWNANKFSSDTGWCGADFNADGVTDVGDFNIWNNNITYV